MRCHRSKWLLLGLVLAVGACGRTSKKADVAATSTAAASSGDAGGVAGSTGGASVVTSTGGDGTSDATGGQVSTGGAAASGGSGGGDNAGGEGGEDFCELPVPPVPEEASPWLVALDGLPTLGAEAYCEYQSRCLYGFEVSFDDVPGGCVGYYEHDFAAFAAGVAASVDSGRAEYDAEAMQECFASVASAACGEVEDFLCRSALLGLVAPGGECESSFDCEGLPNASCQVSDRCPGVCRTFDDPDPAEPGTQEEGMSCGAAQGCLPGLYCVTETIYTNPGQPAITRSWCVVPIEAYDVCPRSFYPCVDDGFVCAQDESGQWLCQPPGGEGDPCYTGGPSCEPGLVCLPLDDETSLCSQFEYADPGEVCGAEVECASGSVCVWTGDSDGLARCVETAQSGGTCYLDNCPINEYCPLSLEDQAAGNYTASCLPNKAVGEPCTVGNECGPFAFCSLCEVCEPKVDVGEACRHDWGCWGRCIDGTCTASGVAEVCL